MAINIAFPENCEKNASAALGIRIHSSVPPLGKLDHDGVYFDIMQATGILPSFFVMKQYVNA